MPDLAPNRIVVVGGGICGLTTALAFAPTGAEVVLFEQAPAFKEVGAGIQITPNGARVLEALGLGPRLAEIGQVADAVVPTDALTGRRLARFDLADQRPRYRFMHRAALIDLLAQAAEVAGVTIHLNTTVPVAVPNGSVTYAPVSGPQMGQAFQVDADLVVFADGVRSIGRKLLPASSGEAAFTGQVAWRAVVDQAAPPEARIWMAPGRHVVTYPIAPGRLNIVAVQERAQWAEEGWQHSDDPANLRAAFADVTPELSSILGAVKDVGLWGLFRHKVAPVWHYDRMVIAGDAAHPTLPFLAQGANLAIEDGYVLARCVREAATIEDGLRAYQAARAPRVARAIAAANANARNYHLSGLKRRVAHLGLKALGTAAPNAFLGRMSWLYGQDVTQGREETPASGH